MTAPDDIVERYLQLVREGAEFGDPRLIKLRRFMTREEKFRAFLAAGDLAEEMEAEEAAKAGRRE
jgi:hypothetical protein